MYKIVSLVLCLIPFVAVAQTEDIFPNLSDDALLEALVDEYKPAFNEVMSYGEARDILFGLIDRENGKVACIYTQHEVNLPDGEDPTTYIYQNGSPNGINTEHSFPQSMGAEFGAAKSDMHHLFPARVAVNTARASLPFDDIQDFETDVWYYQNEEQSNIPSSNKDLYSEGTNQEFEPREAAKGDIARAMFYFYTMYKPQADGANPTFFASQKNRLCQWHHADPADQDEINRTNLIAVYQGEKANPFVLDCTLAARCYCEEHPSCPITSTQDLVAEQTRVEVYPNPASDVLSFKFETNTGEQYQFQLWTIQGINALQKTISTDSSNIHLPQLSNALYFYSILDKTGKNIQRGKLLIQ